MGVEFGKLEDTFEGGLELANLLVHGNALDREPLRGVGITDTLETLGSFLDFGVAGVEVAHGVHHRQILGGGFEDLFVLGNGVLQFALLDVFLRSAENLLFVEAETKRHKSADSSLSPPKICSRKLGATSVGSERSLNGPPRPLPGGIVGPTRAIVRLVTENRMVTKGYQKGVYDRVTEGTWESGRIGKCSRQSPVASLQQK